MESETENRGGGSSLSTGFWYKKEQCAKFFGVLDQIKGTDEVVYFGSTQCFICGKIINSV